MIAVGVGQPRRAVAGDGAMEVGVVVAGNHGDVPRIAQRLQPVERGVVFRIKAEIDEVAGDGDVVRDAAARISSVIAVSTDRSKICARLRRQFT